MAGLIAALFGGKSSPSLPDPHPGIGGYDLPRGPYGEGGFPGSTSAAPKTHSQKPGDGDRHEQLTASGAQQEWRRNPPRRRSGQPQQPPARDDKQAKDTIRRSTPMLAVGVPGNENQRNTKYYGGRRAAPENPAYDGHGPARFVYRGGGYETYAEQSEMPYRIHARTPGYRGAPSNRGADLNGTRLNLGSGTTGNTPQFTSQGGAYGIARKAGLDHKPPVGFSEPPPWSARYGEAEHGAVAHVEPPARGHVTGRRRRRG